jgi:pyridoxamine 5'-phosphate oxidase
MNSELNQYNLDPSPVASFLRWYEEALKVEDNADAMTLSTYDSILSRPHSRTVLYKGMKDNNIVFYTNYLSKKGEQISGNNEVSLLFYWHKSIRQVRIQGRVSKLSEKESKEYFLSRDKESQIASYISKQSHPISSKEQLIDKFNAASEKFKNSEVEKPEHWGGYKVAPYEIEFFIYGKNRLNDRFLYTLNNNNWEISRLQP